MCRLFVSFVLLLYLAVVNGESTVLPQPEELLNCIQKTNNTTVIGCPPEAACAEWNGDFYCFCDNAFILNTNWRASNNESVYCLPKNQTTTEEQQENKLVTYIRSPMHTENVAFGLLMVLVAAITFTAVVFFILVIKPLKRTRKFYVQLRRKRHNRFTLEEFDESDLSWHASNPHETQ